MSKVLYILLGLVLSIAASGTISIGAAMYLGLSFEMFKVIYLTSSITSFIPYIAFTLSLKEQK